MEKGQHKETWWRIAQPLGVGEMAYTRFFGIPIWEESSDEYSPVRSKPKELLDWELANPKPTSEEFILKLANRIATLENILAKMGAACSSSDKRYEYSVFAIPNTTYSAYFHNQLRELARAGWEIYATDTTPGQFGCSVYFIQREVKQIPNAG